MARNFLDHLQLEIDKLREQGLYKSERIITSQQQAHIVAEGRQVINLCANNYLGLANHPKLIEAARAALTEHGYGLASVRFICGTSDIHKKLESELAAFLGMEDAILYSSCFDANGGLFETLLGPEDAIISDELNHASIIDGIRLCKAKRFKYRTNDLVELEERLKEASTSRFRLIATDGVFSMDGTLANLPAICDLAERYQALVMVDDSHAVGFMGEKGRGTHEHWNVMERVDILTGTMGKALGGASGGYVAARKEIVDWLRQRSRPYLFSNTLAPVITAATRACLKLLAETDEPRVRLRENTAYFRQEMTKLGFDLIPGSHPIIPVMIKDALKAKQFADALLDEGLYVIGFSFPVVPHGKARIRTQMSAAHSRDDLQKAVQAFAKVGKKLGII